MPNGNVTLLVRSHKTREDAIAACDFGESLSDAPFDIYIDENVLIYSKRHCAEEDTHARFFLHIIATDASDIPSDRQEYGFDNLDFNHLTKDVDVFGGSCVVLRALPDYPIASIHTRQFTDSGAIWHSDINLGE